MTSPDASNEVFQLALQFVLQTSQSIFLTGKAGTGKTTFLRNLKTSCQKNMVIVAPTGVAAMNAGGVTMHSFFQLPFMPFLPIADAVWNEQPNSSNEYQLIKNIRFSETKRELIRELDLLVIDEVSMLRADMLDAIDCILRSYRSNRQPFGGVQVLFIGDLYQLPPVVNRTEWELLKPYYASPFFFESKAIALAPPVYIELKKIYRQQDAGFISLLNHIRNNELNGADYQVLQKRFQPQFAPGTDQYITLTTHNAQADAINQQALARLSGPGFSYEGELKGDFDLRSVTAEKSLLLKKGAQVMFIKNDKGEQRRYFNGKIATVMRITPDDIYVKFPDEPGELQLEKEVWKNIRYGFDREKSKLEEETLGSFTQFPIRLAWAITIHKSQGLTFERAIIDAGNSFAPGQVYVALSRLVSLEGLVLRSVIEPRSISTDERIKVFSARERDEQYLREQLTAMQEIYLLEMVAEIFHLSKVSAIIEDLSQSYAPRKIPEKAMAETWAMQLHTEMAALRTVSEKFSRQLEQLLPGAKEDGYRQLQQRTRSAADYFNEALHRLADMVSRHHEMYKQKHGSKNYTRELFLLKKMLLNKKQQLDHIASLISGVASGEPLESLLKLTVSEKAEAPAEEKTETKERAKKGDSNLVSLRLFKEHKDVGVVAKLRGITSSTVESHLISFLGTGEIELVEFVDQRKIDAIENLIRSEGTTQLTPLKQKLGPQFSFSEIRAVVKQQFLAADSKIS